jgi:hypothetical protein
MKMPTKGQRGIYTHHKLGEIKFVVHSIDGNLCWAEYDNDKGNVQPFIWRFKDGYNTMHRFIGKVEA